MVPWSVQPTWRMHAVFVELCINFHFSMSSTHSLSSSGSSQNLSGPFQNIISVAPMVRPRQHLEFSTLNFDIADIHRIPIPLPSPPSRIEFLLFDNPLEPSLPSLSTSYAQTVNFWHSDQYRSLCSCGCATLRTARLLQVYDEAQSAIKCAWRFS